MDQLKLEIENLQRNLIDAQPSIINQDRSTIITVNIRKCLALRITANERDTVTAKLYISETNNLKPERTAAIDEFLKNSNSMLDSIVDGARPNGHLFTQLYDKCTLMLVGEDFLRESFDVIESKSKNCLFKFDDDNHVAKSELVSKPDSKNKQTAAKKAHNDSSPGFKKKFKGSDYIFQRIKWDQNIDKSQVVIGYLDRFLGIKDIKFEDFKGVHEDYKEGVPFHRIRYFKINDRIVWDREQKIDLLTGSGDSVSDFFEPNQVDELITEEDVASSAQNPFFKGDIYEFVNDEWKVNEDNSGHVDIPDNFSLLSYNLMSKVNFKKSIMSKMNFKKSQMEVMSRLIDDEDEYGLKGLEKIDRMGPILKSIRESGCDLLVLQECDQYEEDKLREDEFIRKNYFICSLDRKHSKIEHPNCVILSRPKPVMFQLLRLTEKSNKYALLAKFTRSNEQILVANVHLSSNKAKNFVEKRKTQLENLKRYLIDQVDEFDFAAKHYFICGDFNFGDNEAECHLIRDLFGNYGFRDLVTNVDTFEPEKNFAAAVTAFNTQPRRLDRILYKCSGENPLELVNSYLFNTAPFKIDVDLSPPILYQPYLSIRSYVKDNRIKIDSNSVEKITMPVEYREFFLHPSDHYGLECEFKSKSSPASDIGETKVVHKSALAIIAPKHSAEGFIQAVRKTYDPQFNRWPPHINLLYPFFDDISIDLSRDEEASIVGQIFTTLAQFKPFKCDLDRLNVFENNGVVFLEPSKESTKQIKRVYDGLVELFSKNRFKNSASSSTKWKKGSLNPHMTIAQPNDKRKVEKKWARETLSKIINQHKPNPNTIASFTVDCVYWIRRTDTTPFHIEHAFPLGARYPPIRANLNLSDLSSDRTLLKFMEDKGLITSDTFNERLEKTCDMVVDSVVDAVRSVAELNRLNSSSNPQIRFELSHDGIYYSLITCGSFMHGIKCNDLDLALVRRAKQDEEFASNLAYELSQNDQLFHIARSVKDAIVPIIELCLRSEKVGVCEAADVQIHEIHVDKIDEHVFFDSFKFMKRLESEMGDYGKLFPLSGLFENQNIKKYIKNYKDFQILVSFIKYWAKNRCIYGKAFGYLGGISWSLLVAFYLQSFPSLHELELDNGDSRFVPLVKGFFEFYATYNWSRQPVCLIDLEFVARETGRYHDKSPMMIHQTVYPYHNTCKNVNENSRRVIKSEFERASVLLKSNTSWHEVAKQLEKSDLPENLISFRIEYKSPDDLNHLYVILKAKIQGLVTSLLRINSKVDFRVFTNLFDFETNGSRSCCRFIIGVYGFSSLSGSEKQLLINHCNGFLSTVKSMCHASDYEIVLESGDV